MLFSYLVYSPISYISRQFKVKRYVINDFNSYSSTSKYCLNLSYNSDHFTSLLLTLPQLRIPKIHAYKMFKSLSQAYTAVGHARRGINLHTLQESTQAFL